MDALNPQKNTLLAGLSLVLFVFVYYGLLYRYGLNLALKLGAIASQTDPV